MAIPKFNTIDKWDTEEDGHVFITKAINDKGRIIGKVKVHVGIQTKFALEDYLGKSSQEIIERSARKTLEEIVVARYSEQ